jgi:hypothetical protein
MQIANKEKSHNTCDHFMNELKASSLLEKRAQAF